ncbi:MAG: hypothetical protein MR821_12315 [Clostridiales bacterium]|nr:hypothetical protein [Clostridiales bacterium]
MKAFKIPSITESLASDVREGRMTLTEAAAELCRSGWMNWIDVERAARLLGVNDFAKSRPVPSPIESA